MDIRTRRARLPIAAGHLASLVHARGTRLTVLSGTAWITIDGDARDIVLEPGESFVVDADAPLLIHALHALHLKRPLELMVDEPPHRGAWQRLRAWFAPTRLHAGSGAMASA